jgi:hypothetical protein
MSSQQKSKDWISPETWNIIDSRKEAEEKVNETKSERLKQKHQYEYSKIQKEAKKITAH